MKKLYRYYEDFGRNKTLTGPFVAEVNNQSGEK